MTISIDEYNKQQSIITQLQIKLNKSITDKQYSDSLVEMYENSIGSKNALARTKSEAQKLRKQKEDLDLQKSEVKRLTELNTRQSFKIKELEKELDENSVSKFEFNNKLIDIDRLNAVSERLNIAIERLSNINEHITKDNESLSKENLKLVESNCSFLKILAEKTNMIELLKDEKIDLNELLKNKEEDIQKLSFYKEQITSLKDKLLSLKKDNIVLNTTFKNINDEHTDHIDNLMKDLSSNKDKYVYIYDKNIQLKIELKNLRKNYDELQDELIRNAIKIERLENSNVPLEEKIEELVFELDLIKEEKLSKLSIPIKKKTNFGFNLFKKKKEIV